MEAKICVCAGAARVGMCLFAAGGDSGFSLTCGYVVLNLYCSVQGLFMMHFKVTSRALRAYG